MAGFWSRLFSRRPGGPRPYTEVVREVTDAVARGKSLLPDIIDSDAWVAELKKQSLERRKNLIDRSLPEIARDDPERLVGEALDRIRERKEEGSDALQPAENGYYAVFGVEMEVDNGGFHQYFLNSAGNDAALALEWLDRIGARQEREILEAACRRFPGGIVNRKRKVRLLALEKLGVEAFSDLDHRWFARRQGSLETLMRNWMIANPDAFSLPGNGSQHD